MNLRQAIVNYQPTNEQEDKDKTQMLKFMNCFVDVLTRDNVFGHFSASAMVVNPSKTKMILLNHKILGHWVYPGGHADGEKDLLKVAVKEVIEETGLNPKVLNNKIFTLQTYEIPGHIKKGKFISPHLHFDVVYLMEADDSLGLVNPESESTAIKWVELEEIKNNPNYEFTLKKLVNKLAQLQENEDQKEKESL